MKTKSKRNNGRSARTNPRIRAKLANALRREMKGYHSTAGVTTHAYREGGPISTALRQAGV